MAEFVRQVRASGNSAPISFLILALMLFAVAGCGGASNPTNVSSISISPSAITVGINTQADFTATVTLANSTVSTNTAVTWQVNGTTGGNSTLGTIVASTTDADVGIYTAPAVVPTTTNGSSNGVTTNGQVAITAIITTSSSSSSSSSSTTITSNTAIATIGVGEGLAVAPTQATVPAGGNYQFTATLNSVTDTNAKWAVSSTAGGDIGSINTTTGLYTAPNAPPPGGQITITATDNTVQGTNGSAPTATATATIVFSDASLRGPFAFSYTGNDSSGFRAVAGRFVADGAGTIESGIEDIDSFGTHVASAVTIQSGTYQVGADGRTSATVNTSHGTEVWQFVLASTQHALLIRFDTSATGSGIIDQQNLNDLSNSLAVISGPYVFLASGGDAAFNPMGIAGRFSANGAGALSSSGTAFDQNDNGTPTSATLTGGSYSFDAVNSGTGRGLISISSSGSTSQLQFAFYVIDNTHIHIVETDQVDYLAGDIYAEPSASSYGNSILASAGYAFTAGGNSSAGAYASGGLFTADGNGNITGGAFDGNNAGTLNANASLGACTYSVAVTTGRIDLKLCPSGSNLEFASYPAVGNTFLMLEIDSTAVATGTAYLAQGSPVALSGHQALALTGQGIFHALPGSYQSDAEGEAVISGTVVSAGNLDINNYGTVYPADALSTTSTTFVAPASNNRGTATLAPTDPPATYSLAYYWVSPNFALVVGQDTTRVLTGVFVLQY
jgi:hypothetical protein